MKDRRLVSSLCLALGLFLPVIRTFRSLINSPSNAEHLNLLIDEQDDILDHLEVAETRYITSIRASTPTSSIADFNELQPTGASSGSPARPEIGGQCLSLLLWGMEIATFSLTRLQGCSPSPSPQQPETTEPYASSPLLPTSFLTPSYYKIRIAEVVNDEYFTDPEDSQLQTRVVGNRF